MTVVLIVAAQSVSAQEVDYSNTNTFTTRFSTGSLEVGNEITLAGGTYRNVSSFTLEYYLPVATTGNETADVRFYLNDSSMNFAGYTDPGTLFFDSGAFPIIPTGSTGYEVPFGPSDFTTGVTLPLTGPLPDSFTWTIQFGGLSEGEDVGVDLYAPVTIGSAPRDMWEYVDGSWMLVTNDTYALTFGLEVDTVPEPSPFLLMSFFGVVGFVCLGVKRYLKPAC